MILATVLLNIMQSLISALLGCLTTRPGAVLLTTPTIELWTATSGSVDPQSTYGQFTTANFSGYVKQAVTLTGPVALGGNIYGLIGSVTFIAAAASPFVGNVVLGYILSDGVSNLYAAEQFAAPVPFGGPESFLTLNFVVPLAALQPI